MPGIRHGKVAGFGSRMGQPRIDVGLAPQAQRPFHRYLPFGETLGRLTDAAALANRPYHRFWHRLRDRAALGHLTPASGECAMKFERRNP
ncbi:hypothetical protein AWV79_26990 [Cupriavidus sp. UYMMa02A]|nr:hypothetical protein AWV79_26990 [Cupriavidus sp. UYMMa02A]